MNLDKTQELPARGVPSEVQTLASLAAAAGAAAALVIAIEAFLKENATKFNGIDTESLVRCARSNIAHAVLDLRGAIVEEKLDAKEVRNWERRQPS